MGRLLRAVVSIVALVVLIGFAAVALAGQPRQAGTAPATPPGQDPPATSAPGAVSPTVPPQCTTGLSVYFSSDGPDPTLKVETTAAQVVVVAKVQSVGAPIWNTPASQGPTLTTKWPHGLVIFTPVTIEVSGTGKGASLATMTVRMLGGVIGCDRFVANGAQIPPVGASIAMFLSPSVLSSGAPDAANLEVTAAWPISAEGTVSTPLDGAIAVPAFLQQVRVISAAP